MPKILDEIAENKYLEIEERKKADRGFVFRKALRAQKKRLAVIAEIKLKSPSAGELGTIDEAIKRVKAYEAGGADALSIVTDTKYFGGSLKLLAEIRKATTLPILQKDFIVDPYQIYEAKQHGADALLLIARMHTPYYLFKYMIMCLDLLIEPVIEVHTKKELLRVLWTKNRVVGVNARDLNTLEMNMGDACQIIKRIPRRCVSIGFSGVQTPEDAKRYKDAGAQAVLIGSSLMRSADPGALIKQIKSI